jgi:hypothetical protein
VQTKKMLIQVYALAGPDLRHRGLGDDRPLRLGVADTASTGQLGNIQSITAVVIGGISLFGGRGSIVGMFFGALIVGVFEMGLNCRHRPAMDLLPDRRAHHLRRRGGPVDQKGIGMTHEPILKARG